MTWILLMLDTLVELPYFYSKKQKNIHAQQQNYGKFLPKTQQYKNNKITIKNYRFSRHNISGMYNPNLIELILKPVLMYLNVFSYWGYL